MKILLVSPESPDTFWGLKNALKFISKKASLPPLGLLTVAAMLPKTWEKRLIDMAAQTLRDKDIRWADYVFLTGLYIQRRSVREVIDRCRKLGVPVAGGGPIFNAVPKDFNHVEHLVFNEAEVTLPQFLADLQKGEAAHTYESDKFADMQDTPIPAWELIDKKRYALMAIQYSRGCPFNCDFCDVTRVFGRRMRTKTKEQMVAELEALYSGGWRGPVFVVDDNFICDKKSLKEEVLPAIIDWMRKRDYPFWFNTQASINLADDDELMRLMVDAGFNCVFVGIESADEESLAECNKMQNSSRDLVACVRKIQSFGMQVQAGFILGFDSDKTLIFQNMIKFIQQSGIVTAMVGLLNAPRGTRLHERLSRENRLLRTPTGDNTDFSINFIPKMGLEDLVNGYKEVVETIYSDKYYYERIHTLFRNFNPPRRTTARPSFSDLRTLFKSMWKIGIVSKGRAHYWKLLFWAIRRPQYLHTAVTFIIHGFHFRKVFSEASAV